MLQKARGAEELSFLFTLRLIVSQSLLHSCYRSDKYYSGFVPPSLSKPWLLDGLYIFQLLRKDRNFDCLPMVQLKHLAFPVSPAFVLRTTYFAFSRDGGFLLSRRVS
ncbi:uncharacterized protein EV420DRAFT_1520027 [Desarmillaria tabescens]|uniref:Uncharacterized protein n=1 Tax=Armillaria tabescens TaxID=1929756 RepID=A0AA39TUD2_ARMTA|nr:uncharacterized protein EV420DRAFT_1520027 [Desarmillaria tabescens]KAK0463784.1 hypothetical protein EV420DRAFT_1520027 [Desarmillaria tabescens]